MYISKLSKLNLILMIWSYGLYDMLTFLLFRLCVISLIFHPPFFFFYLIISPHLLLKAQSWKSEYTSRGRSSYIPETRRAEKSVAAFPGSTFSVVSRDSC